MKTRILWTPLALADLRAIRAWLKQQNPAGAVKFAETVKHAVSLLASFPKMGPATLDLEPAGRYRHVVRGWHRIIYRLDGDKAYILRIWDSRRNPDDLTPLERD